MRKPINLACKQARFLSACVSTFGAQNRLSSAAQNRLSSAAQNQLSSAELDFATFGELDFATFGDLDFSENLISYAD